MALAHHLITIIYNVLARGENYVELGGDYYDQRSRPKVVARMVQRLMKLGYQVALTAVETEWQLPIERAETTPVPGEAEATGRRADAVGETMPSWKPKRGRPGKCEERGIICKHARVVATNLSQNQELEAGRFL